MDPGMNTSLQVRMVVDGAQQEIDKFNSMKIDESGPIIQHSHARSPSLHIT